MFLRVGNKGYQPLFLASFYIKSTSQTGNCPRRNLMRLNFSKRTQSIIVAAGLILTLAAVLVGAVVLMASTKTQSKELLEKQGWKNVEVTVLTVDKDILVSFGCNVTDTAALRVNGTNPAGQTVSRTACLNMTATEVTVLLP